MHPAPSIIAFTTASGAGYGLLLVLAAGVALGLVPPLRWLGFTGLGLALLLITGGLLASTFHLGHPERIWRTVSQWRSSWLSREGVAALATYIPAAGLILVWVLFEPGGPLLVVLALLCALGAVVTVYCTGMIYASLKPIREWDQPLTPWLYLAFALMTGALLGHLVLILFGVERTWLGVLALVATIGAFGLKLAWWHRIDRAEGGPSAESATGLGALGKVRMIDPPHTQTNYLLSEMGYQIARRHAQKLRVLALALGLGLCSLGTLLALVATGAAAALLALIAAACGLIGVAVERWLFFAEATHTVTLYYGRESA